MTPPPAPGWHRIHNAWNVGRVPGGAVRFAKYGRATDGSAVVLDELEFTAEQWIDMIVRLAHDYGSDQRFLRHEVERIHLGPSQ